MTTNLHETAPTAPPDREVAAALAGSAAVSAAVSSADAGQLTGEATSDAALAWRWVLGTEALDLYAAQPASTLWRATYVGAGGALHRARLALAADGLAAQVTLMPEGSERSNADRLRGGAAGWGRPMDRSRRGGTETPHLARLVVVGTVEVTDETRGLYDAIDPDDGPRVGAAPSRGVVRDLVGAARAEGVRLRLIRDGRDLVGVLHGPDSRDAWLRAGMAASAIRLLARRLGLQTAAALAADASGSAAGLGAGVGRGRTGLRRIGDREGWLSVGIGHAYLRLRLSPEPS